MRSPTREAALLDAGRPRRAASPRLYARLPAELDRLGRWDREQRRRYAAERVGERPGRVGRPPGVRLRVRGLHRRRVDAARGARRARRRHRLAAVRARPAGVRLARAHRRRPDPARGRPHRGAAAAGRGRQAPALAHLERTLFGAGTPTRSRRRSTARFASSRPPAARRRSSSPREEILDLLRDGARPRTDRRRGAVGRARARARSRPPSARSASRTRSRGAIPLDRTPFGRALLGLLRFAWLGRHAAAALRASCARASRACRARAPTSSKDGCAAARSPIRRGSRRRP